MNSRISAATLAGYSMAFAFAAQAQVADPGAARIVEVIRPKLPIALGKDARITALAAEGRTLVWQVDIDPGVASQQSRPQWSRAAEDSICKSSGTSLKISNDLGTRVDTTVGGSALVKGRAGACDDLAASQKAQQQADLRTKRAQQAQQQREVAARNARALMYGREYAVACDNDCSESGNFVFSGDSGDVVELIISPRRAVHPDERPRVWAPTSVTDGREAAWVGGTESSPLVHRWKLSSGGNHLLRIWTPSTRNEKTMVNGRYRLSPDISVTFTPYTATLRVVR